VKHLRKRLMLDDRLLLCESCVADVRKHDSLRSDCSLAMAEAMRHVEKKEKKGCNHANDSSRLEAVRHVVKKENKEDAVMPSPQQYELEKLD
jgi:hypothetical protein